MERSPVMNKRAIPTVITLIGLLSSGNLAEEMNRIYEQRAASNELPEDGVTVEDLARSQRAKVNIRASTGAKVTYKPPRDKRGDFAFLRPASHRERLFCGRKGLCASATWR